MNEKPNIVLKHLVLDIVTRAKLMSSPQDLDHLLTTSVPQLQKACRFQDHLLCEKEVSERWGFLTVRQLQNMRFRHRGPKYHKMGNARNSRVYYRISDIEAWIVEHEQLEPFLEPFTTPS